MELLNEDRQRVARERGRIVLFWFVFVSLAAPAGIGAALPLIPVFWITFAATVSTMWSGPFAGLVFVVVLAATYLSASVLFAGLTWCAVYKRWYR